MSEYLKHLLKQYTIGILDIYGNDLKSVILYGSYARNDFNEDSDQDIMILVNLTEEQIQNTREIVSEYTYDFNMKYDLNIIPVVKSADHFEYWSKVYPFYININKEGVELYAS